MGSSGQLLVRELILLTNQQITKLFRVGEFLKSLITSDFVVVKQATGMSKRNPQAKVIGSLLSVLNLAATEYRPRLNWGYAISGWHFGEDKEKSSEVDEDSVISRSRTTKKAPQEIQKPILDCGRQP